MRTSSLIINRLLCQQKDGVLELVLWWMLHQGICAFFHLTLVTSLFKKVNVDGSYVCHPNKNVEFPWNIK